MLYSKSGNIAYYSLQSLNKLNELKYWESKAVIKA